MADIDVEAARRVRVALLRTYGCGAVEGATEEELAAADAEYATWVLASGVDEDEVYLQCMWRNITEEG